MARLKRKKHFGNKDLIYIAFFLFYTLWWGYRTSDAVIRDRAVQVANAQVKKVVEIKPIKLPDQRVTKLKEFLEAKSSPLSPYSEMIVAKADEYDIGWTKIVAISKMESNYGLATNQSSHNAWGVKGDGGLIYFSSWEDGIQYVSRLLGTSYKWNENKGIQYKYCPTDECDHIWASTVTAVTEEILVRK